MLEDKVIFFQIFILSYSIIHYCFSGIESRIERATHIDFNGDNMIGRLPDTYPGGGYPMNYGGAPGYGGVPPGYGGGGGFY